MKVFDYMEKFGHEQVVYFYDKTTGLKGITAIHDTSLGPAMGGTRLYDYKNENNYAIPLINVREFLTNNQLL